MSLSVTYKSPAWVTTLLAALSAFCVYTCMYAFRKPFTVAEYAGLRFLNIDYKIWLVISQTAGYTLSKFFGIKFIAELKNKNRTLIILKFIGIAWVALLFFALVPAPYNIIFLLINGFPLGIIYGLVFSYLEGRKTTEFLGAALSSSFIFASGFTQSVGKFILLKWGIDQWWMPWVTGLLFFIPLLFFTWLLEKTPKPTEEDVLSRTERKPMNKKERLDFIKTFFPGLVMLTIVYVMLTIIRDYRSNFAANIWKEAGHGNDISLFTKTEIPSSLVVLVLMSLLVYVKRNIQAFLINHFLIVFGFVLSLSGTLMFIYGQLSAFWWMTITGVGLYMGYVPFNCMLFERLIASFRYVSTAGFIIYIADSFGYLGSDVVLLIKNFSNSNISYSDFFVKMILGVSALGTGLTILSSIYFRRKYQRYFSPSSKLSYA
jgi:MFS family permease